MTSSEMTRMIAEHMHADIDEVDDMVRTLVDELNVNADDALSLLYQQATRHGEEE
ncbi:hypothetical protein VST7929_01537 [Vibrio stylophorae]|uniref:ANTAR domain-containing protein n=1 Tax=Vibrio stylophorae TaxID=659351 RepID=A0ABM8ZTM4_9VIBR|nr:hypothetical protein [Vibrio stylophorae]CAH0533666.1 hypothetical protein VST7929_01537 [Vibrio stylophorae]